MRGAFRFISLCARYLTEYTRAVVGPWELNYFALRNAFVISDFFRPAARALGSA
jgi:hypothetical protein